MFRMFPPRLSILQGLRAVNEPQKSSDLRKDLRMVLQV